MEEKGEEKVNENRIEKKFSLEFRLRIVVVRIQE